MHDRGRGPLKTTMGMHETFYKLAMLLYNFYIFLIYSLKYAHFATDVINAAKKISELGTKLDKYARQIGDHCPESSTKNDLLAYLGQIALYCHQLNITSKVKADVQNISGDLVLSGVYAFFRIILIFMSMEIEIINQFKTISWTLQLH